MCVPLTTESSVNTLQSSLSVPQVLTLSAPLHPYHLEAPGGVEFTLHHVKEDGDGGLPKLRLRNQGHFQDWADHFRDEFYLVLTFQ